MVVDSAILEATKKGIDRIRSPLTAVLFTALLMPSIEARSEEARQRLSVKKCRGSALQTAAKSESSDSESPTDLPFLLAEFIE